MRKILISAEPRGGTPVEGSFLDLERLARVELTSEDPEHPIESALVPGRDGGWRAAGPGPQRIHILFDEPRPIRRVHLVFEEADVERTQEVALSWRPAREEAGRSLVRQQYTFSPGGSTREVEDYALRLDGVSALELEIVPDLGGGPCRASMVSLRVA